MIKFWRKLLFSTLKSTYYILYLKFVECTFCILNYDPCYILHLDVFHPNLWSKWWWLTSNILSLILLDLAYPPCERREQCPELDEQCVSVIRLSCLMDIAHEEKVFFWKVDDFMEKFKTTTFYYNCDLAGYDRWRKNEWSMCKWWLNTHSLPR